MKIIVTTSNAYSHIVPIFCFLFNRNWSKHQPVELVGYDKPNFQLPPNFTFHSLGTQTNNKKDFSNDLSKYFAKQDQWFIWLMEDTFIKSINYSRYQVLQGLAVEGVGRINLTDECVKQERLPHFSNVWGLHIYENTQTAKYRLSTQPSIWNRDFLLKYMTPNLSPWEFETQESINDGYRIVGSDESCLIHNEGVRKFDLYKFNLDGISEDQLDEMKSLKII